MEGLKRKLKELTEEAIRSSAVFKENQQDIDRKLVTKISVIEPFSTNEEWEIIFNGTCELKPTFDSCGGARKFDGRAHVIALDNVELDNNTIFLK